jgi:hypothetical protein
MDDQSEFTLTVSQNKFLAGEDAELHAILTVTARGLVRAPRGQAPDAAEVIAIDCSGSMANPSTKISAARNATAAAIDALRDGVFFAVVEGSHTARMVYPTDPHLVAATSETRGRAKAAVRRLVASGGTAMSTWLRLTDRLLAEHPAAVRHVILLTDGQNMPQDRQDLDEALAACDGRFVCEGRGIGDDYAPAELQRIVSALHGSADAILDDSDLVSDFTAMMHAAMGKVVPDVQLQIRTMPYTRLRFVKQAFPTELDLTGLGTAIDERTAGFFTGSWGDGEDREFHVCLELDSTGLARHEDLQAARVELAVIRAGSTEAEACGRPEAIRVHWTEDVKLSSVLDPKVAHYTGHVELAAAVNAGCDAHDAGDLRRAATEWGRAVTLASKLGHDAMIRRLGRLVDIVGDPADGVVRVRQNLRPREIFSVVMGSLISTRSPDLPMQEPDQEQPGAPDRSCPECGRVSPSTAVFCTKCGYSFVASA